MFLKLNLVIKKNYPVFESYFKKKISRQIMFFLL